jgi:hypothetical protein
MRRRNDFKPAAIERMGRIGYFENGEAIWVVEPGINIGYRSTTSLTTSS